MSDLKWKAEKEEKRQQRELEKQMRAMSTPVSRGESLNVMMGQQEQIVSLAMAIESLETLLVEKGILTDNAVMDRMKILAETKRQQMEAANVEQERSRIIVPA